MIAGLSHSPDTEVRERGRAGVGGQWQLIAFTRARRANPALLVLAWSRPGTPDELLAAGGRFADLYARWLAGVA